ncbi:MAG: hypothetical protein K8T20_13165 [Planctomycetes bacterium]|nr:hypothetical protein [Planctomycetota bacterium]
MRTKFPLAAALLITSALACSPSRADDPKEKDSDQETKLRSDMEDQIGADADFKRAGPFLVAGHLGADAMEGHAAMLERCRKALHAQFFTKEPDFLYAVYLFPNHDAYDAFCLKFTGDHASSKYGFYLPSRHALVMNIGTGGGTLVHEMTHALMEVDFPKVPTWFNEGLASLFEQSTTAGGKIKGLVNWRLPTLQSALKDGSFLEWKKLVEFNGPGFYGDGSGLRYATARYLCMWLQEKGKLEAFYVKIRDGVDKDAKGWEALSSVLDGKTEEAEKEWREWAKGLKWE